MFDDMVSNQNFCEIVSIILTIQKLVLPNRDNFGGQNQLLMAV